MSTPSRMTDSVALSWQLRERPGLTIVEFTGEIDFTHPDLAFATRMSSSNAGESRFYCSYDRAKTWEGPFKLPMLEQKGVMARLRLICLDFDPYKFQCSDFEGLRGSVSS